MSLRAHLLQVQKQTKRTPLQLQNLIEFPTQLGYVYKWFRELQSPQLLTWSEINAWSNLKGIKPNEFELDLIIELDNIHWEIVNG